jgi:hypothetical protein
LAATMRSTMVGSSLTHKQYTTLNFDGTNTLAYLTRQSVTLEKNYEFDSLVLP